VWWLASALALAETPPEPQTPVMAAVVAMGDGLVAGPPASEAPPVAGGWVPSLADCLEERAPGRFSVIDRAVTGETAASARKRVREVVGLTPAMVVVTLGAQELADPDATAEALTVSLRDLVGALHKRDTPRVLLVGMVPPTLTQTAYADRERQVKADARTTEWNASVAALAEQLPAVQHVDLWADWPRDAARAELTRQGWSLSEQGHARVAAAICDAVLATP
jgi:hypothetical protein